MKYVRKIFVHKMGVTYRFN